MLQREFIDAVLTLAGEQWCITAEGFDNLLGELIAGPPSLRPQAREEPLYEVENGVATIKLHGALMRNPPWWLRSATDLNKAIEAAESVDDDSSVETVMFDVSSPGGSIVGTVELGDAIHAIKKPTHTHTPDLMASAALWAGVQSDRVTASPSAMVGSIGVYSARYDWSKAFKEMGIEAVVAKTSELKGAGIFGAPITKAQRDEAQRVVMEAGEMFIEAVARGRKMSADRARELATAQVWFAAEAASKGLIDGVATRAPSGESDMPDQNTAASSVTTPVVENTATNAAHTGALVPGVSVQTVDAVAVAQREAAEARAEAALATAALAEVNKNRREALIEAAVKEGRVTATLRTHVDAYAEQCGNDFEKLSAYLAALPVQTRSAPQGDTPPEDNPEGFASADDERIAKALRVSVDDITQYADYRGATFDGELIKADGTIVAAPKGVN